MYLQSRDEDNEDIRMALSLRPSAEIFKMLLEIMSPNTQGK